MQRVGEFVFDLACFPLPMVGVFQPFAAVRYEGPGANMRDAVRERVDVAIGPVRLLDLARKPVLRNEPFVAHDEFVQSRDKLGMRGWRDFPVIRDLANLPQTFDGSRCSSEFGNPGIAGG